VQWSGFLTPPDSGDYLSACAPRDLPRLSVDGKQVATAGRSNGIDSRVGRVHLENGQKVALNVNYSSNDGHPHVQLIWTKVSNVPSPEAITAAKNADVVIAVVGITSSLEGEEMPVSEPGFPRRRSPPASTLRTREALVEAVVPPASLSRSS